MKEYMTKKTLITVMFCIASMAFAQRPSQDFNGKVSGNVFDADYREPIEYANIVLYKQADSMQITGTITDDRGAFQLTRIQPGLYYAEISFIGYETHTVNNLDISADNPEVTIGNVFLKSTILAVEGAEVEAERPFMTYEIDKKVIDVNGQLTTTAGTAVDVLENVPSVKVDIEGNVSLRGSENFTVLIDSRPTILDPSDALQQIPASMIDNIEIITNPSAQYDPEGMSGIINVIMKKKVVQGISGVTNLNAGLNNKYGGDFLVSYRTGIANLYVSANYRKFTFPGTGTTESMTFQNDTSSFVSSHGESERAWNPYGLRTGVDLNLGMWDKLSLGGEYGAREMERTEELNYDKWSEPGDSHHVYVSQEQGDFSHQFYSVILDHLHRFFNNNHTLALHGMYSVRERSGSSSHELLDTTGAITSGHRDEEEGPSQLGQVKLDYNLPINEKYTFKAGGMARIGRSEEKNRAYDYDTATGTYEYMDEFSHATDYSQDIYALYGIFSGSLNGFGFQGGLRSEYTYRLIEIVGQNEQYTFDRWDYFPTAHVSYKFSNGYQLMASYTRRIQRPRPWWLEPFLTWTDAYNVRVGNPDLKPEYIDSYELGFQTVFGTSVFSLDAFYRVTHNNVEQVQSVYHENVILQTVENVGTDKALGIEGLFDLRLTSWWNLNLTGSIFQRRLDGELYGEAFSEEDFNWSARFNTEFKVFSTTTLQITGRYRSPSLSVQGQREGFFTADAAVKQALFNKRLNLTLQVRDVFGTGKREFISEGEDFYVHRYSERESPIVMLSINYNFNNYKQKQRESTEPEFEGMDEME
jgi:outer membrane receptor protein involved in Fe transport